MMAIFDPERTMKHSSHLQIFSTREELELLSNALKIIEYFTYESERKE